MRELATLQTLVRFQYGAPIYVLPYVIGEAVIGEEDKYPTDNERPGKEHIQIMQWLSRWWAPLVVTQTLRTCRFNSYPLHQTMWVKLKWISIFLYVDNSRFESYHPHQTLVYVGIDIGKCSFYSQCLHCVLSVNGSIQACQA